MVKPNNKPADDSLKLTCSGCKTVMRIPKAVLVGKDSLNVKCPNAQCGKIATIRKQMAAAKAASAQAQTVARENEMNASSEE